MERFKFSYPKIHIQSISAETDVMNAFHNRVNVLTFLLKNKASHLLNSKNSSGNVLSIIWEDDGYLVDMEKIQSKRTGFKSV